MMTPQIQTRSGILEYLYLLRYSQPHIVIVIKQSWHKLCHLLADSINVGGHRACCVECDYHVEFAYCLYVIRCFRFCFSTHCCCGFFRTCRMFRLVCVCLRRFLVNRCSKLNAYINLINRCHAFGMPLRSLSARMTTSHRSCSPLHSLFGAGHTNVFVKPCEQSQACLSYAVARKRIKPK